MKGYVREAISLYKSEANTNPISLKRLSITKKQRKKKISESQGIYDQKVNVGFVDWYPGFCDDEGILDLFKLAGVKAEYSQLEDCDIVIAGSYGLE